MMFAIVDGNMGPFGGITYTHKDSVYNSLEFVDNELGVTKPLALEQVSADVQNLLGAFKPILTNMMGTLGRIFHVLYW